MKVIEIQNRVGDFSFFYITWELKSNKILIFDKWLSDISSCCYRKILKVDN